MRRKMLFILTVLVICPIIAINAFANSPNNRVQPQDIQNRDQLSNYIESVENINRDLINIKEKTNIEEAIPVTITFSKYISFDDLENYIDLYGVELQQVQLRGLKEDGTRVTIATLVHMGMDYTEELMYKQAKDQEFELVGITDVYAYILPSKIESISQNELTYLVDASGVETRQVSVNGAEETLVAGESVEKSAFPKSLTWELEDLNIL